MKKILSLFVTLVLLISGASMNLYANEQEKIVYPDLSLSTSSKSIKVGDEFTYSINNFEFDTDVQTHMQGMYREALMFHFFSESTDSSIELQSIEFPKLEFETEDGKLYGALVKIMDFGQTDGIEFTTWLSGEDYTTINRDQFVELTQDFTKSGYRVYVRPTEEGSDYGVYGAQYKSMKTSGPIKFNYKVVDNGQPRADKPYPYFVFSAYSPESDLPANNKFGYVYFADYGLTREVETPFNPADKTLSLKYTVTNTGPYNITNINLYEKANGFVPVEGGWQLIDDIFVKPITTEAGYDIIAPGESREFVQQFKLENTDIKANYTFEGGLYTNGDFANRTDIENLVVNIAQPKFTVNFNTNGGSAVQSILDIVAGSTISMPQTTRSGFTFKGWFVDEALTQKWDFALNRVENNMTLYAKWEANPVIEVFDVNFNSNGGSAVTSQVGLSKGAKVTKPLDPSRSGYSFRGWFVDEAMTTPWDFDTNTVTGNTTLYAKWDVNPVVETFDVRFNSNGGSSVLSQLGLSKGAKVTKPLDPSRSGYSFKGWFVDEAMTMPWNFDTDTVAKNTTLYAKWEAKSTDKTLPATGQSSHNILFVGLGLSVAGLLLLKRRPLQK
ncbi:InlB B-repeat-containing protein [Erysipelothrix aquatica]|uniref:InlB B-repeat-containing protein n=2 Tax=Erysipelothrix aquatica TaxID=2683714 RepID=UPI0013577D76|nr:InlB B-repeat-containing protein [Erysipelothrix aquatica]